jgi:hypothetical protein
VFSLEILKLINTKLYKNQEKIGLGNVCTAFETIKAKQRQENKTEKKAPCRYSKKAAIKI